MATFNVKHWTTKMFESWEVGVRNVESTWKERIEETTLETNFDWTVECCSKYLGDQGENWKE